MDVQRFATELKTLKNSWYHDRTRRNHKLVLQNGSHLRGHLRPRISYQRHASVEEFCGRFRHFSSDIFFNAITVGRVYKTRAHQVRDTRDTNIIRLSSVINLVHSSYCCVPIEQYISVCGISMMINVNTLGAAWGGQTKKK